jgi:hypothetical protein
MQIVRGKESQRSGKDLSTFKKSRDLKASLSIRSGWPRLLLDGSDYYTSWPTQDRGRSKINGDKHLLKFDRQVAPRHKNLQSLQEDRARSLVQEAQAHISRLLHQ